MRKERIRVIILFSTLALGVWLAFNLIFFDSFMRWPFLLVGSLSSAGGTAIVSWVMSKRFVTEARAGARAWRGGLLGVSIALLSYALGAVLFALGANGVSLLLDANYSFSQAFEAFFLMTTVGFVGGITMMSPGFILAGLLGMWYYNKIRVSAFTTMA